MRWLALTLAASTVALAAPAAAQSYGYGYSQPGYGQYGYGQSGYGSDFDYRRCYNGENEGACRDRLRREAEQADRSRYAQGYDPYGRYGDYNRYGYGSGGYSQYGYDYGRSGRQPYYDPRSYGYNGGYYGNGYNGGYYGNGYGGGYYGGGYGRDTGSTLALVVLGVALGAQVLGSMDDRDYWDRHRHDDDYRNWCRRQYSSFDWNSGTYLFGDGTRRYCRR